MRAQPVAPPPQDPLISLMLSQPKIDVTSPVRASASFDPPVTRPGELSTYRVMFNALEESIDWPSKLTLPPNFEMRPGARGQIFQMAGPSMVPLTTFNYHVRAPSPGQFTLSEFVVQVYGQPVSVPAARLDVVSSLTNAAPPSLRLRLEISETNLFVGQPVNVRILLPGSVGGGVQGLAQVQLSGQGFLVDLATAHQRIESRPGDNVATFIHETTLTPVTTGKLGIFAQGYTAGSRFFGVIQGPAIISGGAPQYTLLDSDPVQLEARPLPREGELPGFTGAIGVFGLEAPTLATNLLRVGDPVKLTVTVRGNNLARLIAPPPPAQLKDWQVFSASSDGAPPQFIQARGFATFSYTLIPLTEQTRATPAIPFSSFDPQRGRYLDLTIPSLPITVIPGAIPADLQTWLQPGLAASEKEPVLSGLSPSPGRSVPSLIPFQQKPLFLLLQLIPAAGFVGLWSWDRRRRYLENHPDIVLRRRARRALSRERRALRQAARNGDAERFARAAVSAMRVACAPHYPAEPRALVGSDVLQVLREPSPHEPLLVQGQPAILPLPFPAGAGGESWGEGSVLSPTFMGTSYAPSFPAQQTHPHNWDKTSQVVRRFFTVADATQFDSETADPGELLPLQPELEAVLEELEARL